jgi:hypothetical protein
MTIEECNSAAYRRAPIIHDGIIYSRIVRITRVFTSDELMIRGWPKTYYVVTLADKCGHSYTEADPAKVFLANENLHHELNEKKNAADESETVLPRE